MLFLFIELVLKLLIFKWSLDCEFHFDLCFFVCISASFVVEFQLHLILTINYEWLIGVWCFNVPQIIDYNENEKSSIFVSLMLICL